MFGYFSIALGVFILFLTHRKMRRLPPRPKGKSFMSQATVSSLIQKEENDETISYPVIQYKNKEGKFTTYISDEPNNDKFLVGDSVWIVYVVDNPDNAFIVANVDEYKNLLFYLLLGGVFVVAGLVMLFRI